jgi:Arc/MetJ-type ribon-helix-helix transcriptional regulator
LEQLVAEGIYNSKNEAIRDALRRLFEHFGILHLEEKKNG